MRLCEDEEGAEVPLGLLRAAAGEFLGCRSRVPQAGLSSSRVEGALSAPMDMARAFDCLQLSRNIQQHCSLCRLWGIFHRH